MTLLVPFLNQLLQIGVALTLLTPFVYTESTTFPFVFGKVIVLRIVVELLVALWITVMLFDPSARPRRSAVLTGIAAVAAALLLSVAFGVDWFRSFWGNHERMTGVFSILHALVLVPMAATAFKTSKAWMRFWLWALVTADFMAALGLWQYLSENNFLLTRGGGRIWATLGNYIYLAQYALFFTVLAFMLAALTKSRNVRWFAVGSGVVQIIVLLLTETRGALLGLLAAGAFLAVWFGMRGGLTLVKRQRMGAAVFAAGLLVIIAFFFFGGNNTLAKKIPGLRRLSYTEFSVNAGGASTRLIAWSIALESWIHRPVFGWGVENFNYAFNRYYHPESLRYSFYETWFDRPHNGFLEILSTQGIVGVAAALYLYGAVLRILVRSRSADPPAYRRAGFGLALLLSYLVQITFVFESATSLLLIALFYGWVTRIGWGDDLPLPTAAPPAPGAAAKSVLAALSGVAALMLVFFTNIQPLRANQFGLRGSAAVHRNRDLMAGMQYYRAALAISSPHRRDLRIDLVRDVSEAFGNVNALDPELRPVWEMAVAELEKNVTRWPGETYERLLLGQLYVQGTNFDPEAYEKSAAVLKEAIPTSPKRQQIYLSLAKTLLLQHKNDEAVRLLRQAVSFDDSIADMHWHAALALSDGGYGAESYEEIKKALARGYVFRSDTETIFAAERARSEGDYAGSLALYALVSSGFEAVAEYHARVAEIAEAAGEHEFARQAAARAIALDPSFRPRLRVLLTP